MRLDNSHKLLKIWAYVQVINKYKSKAKLAPGRIMKIQEHRAGDYIKCVQVFPDWIQWATSYIYATKDVVPLWKPLFI